MKVPLSWLKEYVEIEDAPAALAQRLTFAGLEVESLETVAGEWPGVVVGQIIDIRQHPNANNLLLCEVANGQTTRQVVCGANNFRVGDKAPLAEVGAKLPNGQTIAAAVIRGVDSQGMLCAEDELRLGDDHSGILILPADAPLGAALADIIGPLETVLTIEITPNRPDCLSIIGIAREVAAIYGRQLKLPAINFAETDPATQPSFAVQVADPDACPRYTARLLSDIQVASSPLWLRRRLALAGIRPINNVVDITNYVMLECGQPLHAFDQTLLQKNALTVRWAQAGERLETLDGIQRLLTPDILVIADAQQPVAVAGVMGGAASGILATTRQVILESACFKPAAVRQSAKRLGLSSESSYRFERGVDIALADWASRRATALLIQYSGAKAVSGIIDRQAAPAKPRLILCRFERVRRLLGVALNNDQIIAIFKALQLSIERHDAKACAVQPPSFRPDLIGEADLIEEVARLHGLDKIPARAPSCGVSLADDRPTQARMRCRAQLIGLGLSEIMNYSFLAPTLLNRFDEGGAARRIVLEHPLSTDHSVLRPWLLPQLIDALGRNRSRQISAAAFFEIGRVFYSDDSLPAKKSSEEERLAIGLMGAVGRNSLEKQAPLKDEDLFGWLKGILEALLAGLAWRPLAGGYAGVALAPLQAEALIAAGFPARCFQRRRWLSIALDGKLCGVLGLISEEIRNTYRILEPLAALELRLRPLLEHVWQTPAAQALPIYPSVSRDIAISVSNDVQHASIVRAIQKISPKELTDIQLFDIYTSEKLGSGRKSMAYSLTYRSAERTLTDEEVNVLHKYIKAGLRDELKAEIREG